MKTVSFMLEDSRFEYPCFELYQQFAPEVKVVFNEMLPDRIRIDTGQDGCLVFQCYVADRVVCTKTYHYSQNPLDKNSFKGFLYAFLSELFHKELDWGTLTGVKPVKWAHLLLREGKTHQQVNEEISRRYSVSDEKIALMTEIAEREIPFIYPLDRKRISIYVGIPLCIAKCSYCSFISTVADKKGVLAETYLTHLLDEICQTGRLLREKQLYVDTLYIGGGTPSILNSRQLALLLEALAEHFDLSGLREYTFEAGRPETTTDEKLRLLKAYGVDRICLNPQSMNAQTLLAVNRRHSPEDILKTYDMIRKTGFNSVNMDLILGLNHETGEEFMHSLHTVMKLKPENITVHCLSLKKGSVIKERQGRMVENLYSSAFCSQIRDELAEQGYRPYYLYRQKYTQGNGENIGYCLDQKEGIYNMLMMAEKQSIIGIGAGSSGKLYEPATDRFEKIFTVKDIRTYNERAEEIIQRKLSEYRRFFDMAL